MAFEAMSTSVSYKFSSNAKLVLDDIAKRADIAAAALDRLTAAVMRVDAATSKAGTSIVNSMGMMSAATEAAASRMSAATASMTRGFGEVTAAARAAATSAGTVGRRAGNMAPVSSAASNLAIYEEGQLARTALPAYRGTPAAPGGGPGLQVYQTPIGQAYRIPGTGGGQGPTQPGAQRASWRNPGSWGNTAAWSNAFGGGGGGGIPPVGTGGGRGPLGNFTNNIAGVLERHVVYKAIHAVEESALGVAAMAGDAVYQAGKLQTILTTTQNITDASPKQMASLRQQLFDVGNQTGMSAIQSGEMFRSMARQSQGILSFNEQRTMFPYMAKMQVVLGAARHFSPEQTTDAVMALTHLFRQYKPKGMPEMFNTVLKMGELMPDNLNRAVTQMTYFLPTLKNLNVSDADAATMMISMSRFGMGKNKGGTSLQNLMADALPGLQLTKHAQSGKAALMGPAGMNILDEHGQSRFFKDGKPGEMFKYLKALEDYSHKVGRIKAQEVFGSVFGKVGSRLGDMLADPVIVDALISTKKAFETQKSLNVSHQAKTIFETAPFQENRAWKNFESLLTDIGFSILPAATKGFKDLGDSLHDAQRWLHSPIGKTIMQQVSRDLVSGVVGVEKYLVAHKREWASFGNDLRNAYNWASKLGPSVKIFADNLGSLYRVLHDLGDMLTYLNLNKLQARINKSGRDAGDASRLNAANEFIPGLSSTPGKKGSLPAGTSAEAKAFIDEYARQSAHVPSPRNRHQAMPMHNKKVSRSDAAPIVVGEVHVHAAGQHDIEKIMRSAEKKIRKGATPISTPTTPASLTHAYSSVG